MNQIIFSFADWFPAEHLFDPGRNDDRYSNDDGYRSSSTAKLDFPRFPPVAQTPGRCFTQMLIRTLRGTYYYVLHLKDEEGEFQRLSVSKLTSQ